MSLRTLREARRVTVPYAAFMLGISDEDYLRMEKNMGEYALTLNDLYVLAKILGCTTDEVLAETIQTSELDAELETAMDKKMPEFLKRCAMHALKGYILGAAIKNCPTGVPDESRILSSSPVSADDLANLSDLVRIFGLNGDADRELVIKAMQDAFEDPDFLQYLKKERPKNKTGRSGPVRSCELPSLTWFMVTQMEKNYNLVKTGIAGTAVSDAAKGAAAPAAAASGASNADNPPMPPAYAMKEESHDGPGDIKDDLPPIDETSDFYGRLS